MKQLTPISLANLSSNRTGAMLPLLAVVMVILFVAAVLSIDIARIHVTRSELRTATDAAARAAAEALGREQSQPAAIDAAIAVAQQNVVAGHGLTVTEANIAFGTSVANRDGSFSFQEGGTPINSVRVNGERTSTSPDGPVAMMFGPLFGVTDFEPIQSAVATRTERDIALVLDVSGSMRIDGRFAGLKTALDVFLLELENSPQHEHVSLTVYSTTDRKLVDMTASLQLIRDQFAKESPGGMTAIGLGLRTGLRSIQRDDGSREYAYKSIILMTDGQHNTDVNPRIIADDCAAEGVEVHTVTFSSGANQNLMRQVADQTGGTHHHADDNAELAEVFATIARQLQVMLIQ